MDIGIHRRPDGSRMDSKNLNAIFKGFQRQGFIESNEGGLTDDIGEESGYGLHAGVTRYVDDPSLAPCTLRKF